MSEPDSPESSSEELPPFKGRIFIDQNGHVVFENLDEGLAEVALELDPDAELSCALPAAADSSDDAGT